MKVLVIGSGGREHAIVWKLSKSNRIHKLYCAPGNGGIADIAECVPIRAEDIHKLLDFAKDNSVDLTVVGPEVPLSLGIVDLFKSNGMRIFGVEQKAAMLEYSKSFSKEFMRKHNIPTAKYKSYNDKESAVSEIDEFGFPVVIKVDGLAAGKGVIIAADKREAVEAINEMMSDKKFGEAGNTIVVEQFLVGPEVSVLAFVDGNTVIPMTDAQDYKRAMDEDMGLNTGGMGVISPSFHYDKETAQLVQETIIDRTMAAMKAEHIEFKGILFFGLLLTKDGPMVLEYNTRFGDPEAQAVLPRLETDLLDIIEAVMEGRLDEIDIKWKNQSAAGVVMASGGYPEHYETGYEIMGLEGTSDDIIVFHAGTKLVDGKLTTSGGRVLVVTALGESIEEARAKAYSEVKKISYKNAYYRMDIGRTK
ncbi:MAG: phosphoribosylamine--glycine ligase [Bacillota bacterium]